MSVHNTGDAIVVQMRWWAARQVLNAQNTFVLGLVRQHRAVNNVTDGVNAGTAGLEFAVNGNLAALVHFDATGVEAEVAGEWSAADTGKLTFFIFAKN